MATNLLWIQAGGCGGDTWSLLNAESPDFIEFADANGLEILWHPSFTSLSRKAFRELIDALIRGERRLDILCVEGSILRGPEGTGGYDEMIEGPKMGIIGALAPKARFVLAVGTCASFGGLGKDSETEATGLQFHKWEPGGFLGKDFVSGSGMPVINLPGCPCHCDVVTGTISALITELPLALTRLQSPEEWYGMMIHQGCTRNEYHEYRVEEKVFGEKGCMFFHMGCHGPLATGPCNKSLWNRRSSKTRVGVPCFGCTRPDFPQHYPFFETRNIEGIPIELPDGVSRAHYMAYKGMAAAAAPKRLIQRITKI